jgi:hypothetical protein
MSREVSKRNFKKLTADMKAIEAFVTNPEFEDHFTLHDGLGEKHGVVYYDDFISFNGNSKFGLDHESMLIDLGEVDYNFCKTARKPYDLAVCLFLMSIKYHIRSTKVTSDGDADDWGRPFELYKEIFPKRNIGFSFKPWGENSKTLDGSLSITI